MNVEEALLIADTIVYGQRNNHMTTLERVIFKDAWLGKTYENIAKDNFCSSSRARQLGTELFKVLSAELAEKVDKKNFRATIERRREELIHLAPQPSETVLSVEKPNLGETVQTEKIIDVPLNKPHQQIPQEAINKNLDQKTATIELELPGGSVKIGSRFYIPRPPSESLCYQAIAKPGALIRIKAPPKMGKTSLMMRIMDYAASLGYHTVTLDFHEVDSEIFYSLKRLLQWVCASVGLELQLPERVDEYWKEIFGSKTSCNLYFEKYLLAEISQPIVLVFDKLDYLKACQGVANDFFALLRAWYEKGKNIDVWKKLRLVMVYCEEVVSLNNHQSPFNVGVPVQLSAFDCQQLRELVRRHGFDGNDSEINQLMSKLGGHPYLSHLALYELAKRDRTLAEFLQLNLEEIAPYKDYLPLSSSNSNLR